MLKTYSENITDGLEGPSHNCGTKNYLSKVSKPELTSPLRNWELTEDEERSL